MKSYWPVAVLVLTALLLCAAFWLRTYVHMPYIVGKD
jgi:hypothetical protein